MRTERRSERRAADGQATKAPTAAPKAKGAPRREERLKPPAPPPIPKGLTPRDDAELRYFFRDHCAAIGFKSTFGAVLAAHSGVQLGVGSPESWDALAAYVDRHARARPGRRVWAILDAMIAEGDSAHVTVLSRYYGEREPSAPYGTFEALAPLVSMTLAVEAARDEQAARLGTIRDERVTAAFHNAPAHYEEEFWRTAKRCGWYDEQIARAETADERQRIRRERAPWWAALKSLHESYQVAVLLRDAPLRARLGALAGADRETGTTEAMRAELDALPRFRAGADASSDERRRALEEKKRVADERIQFVASATVQAHGLLSSAARGYVAARARLYPGSAT